MSSLLVVVPQAPYPLRASGLSMRYLPLLQHLARSHAIDLAVVGDAEVSGEAVVGMAPLRRRFVHIPTAREPHRAFASRLRMRGRVLLPWTLPDLCTFYEGDAIGRALASFVSGQAYDSVLSVGGLLTPYLRGIRARRLVVDFIDSPSLIAARRVVGTVNGGIGSAYERWKVKRWEASVIRQADASIFISPVDAAAVPPRMTPGARRVVIPNGLSIEGYTTARDGRVGSPSIGFLGNMGYPPNVEAVQWLYREVFLPLRATVQGLSLVVIGRAPDPSIAALGRTPGVLITGAVDDIWPLVNAVDVFAFPLLRGAGLKNKVLEALYARRAVVTSRIGIEGTPLRAGRDLVVAESPDSFRNVVADLLRDPSERAWLGGSGQEAVVAAFDWSRILARFERVLTTDGEEDGPFSETRA